MLDRKSIIKALTNPAATWMPKVTKKELESKSDQDLLALLHRDGDLRNEKCHLHPPVPCQGGHLDGKVVHHPNEISAFQDKGVTYNRQGQKFVAEGVK